MKEWVSIPGYEGIYEININGQIRSLDRKVRHKKEGSFRVQKGKMLTSQINKNTGYYTISLYKKGKEKRFDIHRLLGVIFIENPQNKPEVNHKDGIKTNNEITNLEWSTRSENAQHAHDNNLIKNWKPFGEMNGRAKLTNDNIRYIRANYVKGSSDKGLKALSEKFGVSISTIRRAISLETFKEVN